jgi:aminobenzoyl-glutamate utilization protein B
MKENGMEAKGINGAIKPLEIKEDPSGGSTDVGDVSYIVPEITLMATTAPYESPWHWVVVASGGMSIGHMLFASKSLGLPWLIYLKRTITKRHKRVLQKKRKGKPCYLMVLQYQKHKYLKN